MILQHAWCELRQRKARTLTTVLGYGLAVSSMMVLVGILQVSGQGSAGILDHTGTHFVAFAPADMAACGPCLAVANGQIQSEGLVAFGTRTHLMPHAFVEKIKGISTVADAAPYLQYRFRDPNDGHLYTVGGFDPNNAMVVGTTCCAATDVIDGRFLREGRQRQGPPGAGLCPVEGSQGGRHGPYRGPALHTSWGSSTRGSDPPRRTSTCPIRRPSAWWPPNCPMSPSQAMPT